MVSNSKITRIFRALQEAKDKGVPEIELMDDFEKSGNIRLIKHRLNKMIGDDAVKIVSGV